MALWGGRGYGLILQRHVSYEKWGAEQVLTILKEGGGQKTFLG